MYVGMNADEETHVDQIPVQTATVQCNLRENKKAALLERGISSVGDACVHIGELLRGFDPGKNLAEDVKQIEFIPPMVRPYGCGPVAPADWVVLHTYDRIIEMRAGTRMDDDGLVLNDEVCMYCYQEALWEIQQAASGAAPSASTSKGGTKRARVAAAEERPKEGEKPTRPVVPLSAMTRANIILGHFRMITPHMWHRYMFPFGTFVYHNNSSLRPDLKATLVAGRDPGRNLINPYSVSHTDILYLCNTTGYLDRFMRMIGILLWAKKNDTNLLLYRDWDEAGGGGNGRRSDDCQFFTLERYLHVFGSIYLHITVMTSNKQQVGGNWAQKLAELETLFREMVVEFAVNRELLVARVRDLTVRNMASSLTGIQNFFRTASHVMDNTK